MSQQVPGGLRATARWSIPFRLTRRRPPFSFWSQGLNQRTSTEFGNKAGTSMKSCIIFEIMRSCENCIPSGNPDESSSPSSPSAPPVLLRFFAASFSRFWWRLCLASAIAIICRATFELCGIKSSTSESSVNESEVQGSVNVKMNTVKRRRHVHRCAYLLSARD